MITLGATCAAKAVEAPKPNVVIIISDSARADHFSCYGYDRKTTPKIDAFAKEGTVFSWCISQGNWTSPGLASLVWGTYAVNYFNANPNAKNLSGKVETPIIILKNAGYKAGFYGHAPYQADAGIESLGSIEATFKWIESQKKDSPFLLLYRTHVTHIPYNPVSPYNDMFFDKSYIVSDKTLSNMNPTRTYWVVHDEGKISSSEAAGKMQGVANFTEEDIYPVLASYDGKLRMLDDEIGALIKKIDLAGLKDNTIIVFVGEHGEELLDRNHVGHAADSLDGTLHDELIRVPLIIRYPPLFAKNTVIDRQIELIDVMPTVLDITGTKRLGYPGGKSLAGLLENSAEKYDKEYAFSFGAPAGCQNLPQDQRMLRSLRSERWKLIAIESADRVTYELYDMKKDPLEKRNVLMDNIETAEKLKFKLTEIYERAKSNEIFSK
jgi:arylsulfatase A-like enzyme